MSRVHAPLTIFPPLVSRHFWTRIRNSSTAEPATTRGGWMVAESFGATISPATRESSHQSRASIFFPL